MQDYCDSKEWEELNKDELLKVVQDTIQEEFITKVDSMLTEVFGIETRDKQFQKKFDAAFDKIVALAKSKGLEKRASRKKSKKKAKKKA